MRAYLELTTEEREKHDQIKALRDWAEASGRDDLAGALHDAMLTMRQDFEGEIEVLDERVGDKDLNSDSDIHF